MNQQPINIDFSSGIDTKTDPFQLPVGRFMALKNTVFTTGKRLTKRPGYGELITAPANAAYLTTLNDNLTAIGSQVNTYSKPLNKWINKGTLQPCSLSVTPTIRNSFDQVQADSVTGSGLTLVAYTQTHNSTTQYLYAIADAVTGQLIVQPAPIPVIASGAINGSPRTFIVGNFFVVVSSVLVSSTTTLQYFSVPLANPDLPSAAQNVTSQAYVPTSSVPGWDGVTINNVSNNVLVVAYNTNVGGQGVHVATLNSEQIANNQASTIIKAYTASTDVASILGICVDTTVSPNIVYFTFFNAGNSITYTGAVFVGFGTITTQFAPTATMTALTVLNLTCAAQNNSCTVFAEISKAYSYDSSVLTHYVEANTVSSAGVAGTAYVAIRSVGLASKAFIVNSVVYFLSAYDSQFQSTYFLINGSTTTAASPVIVAKFSYQAGAGYYTSGLPVATLSNLTASIPYLYTDLVEPISVQNTTTQTVTGGVYSQTGVNIINLTLGTLLVDTAEISGSLQISGGFLGQYDGSQVVEQNFFLFPDNVECTYSTTGGSIAAVPSGGLEGGINYYYSVVYAWTDMQGLSHRSGNSIPIPITTSGTASTGSVVIDVPTLRLTAKIANPLIIEIYRWSVATQLYQLVTSAAAPVVNSTTTDSVTFTDTFSDASVEGNLVLYTAGGVVTNANGPASNVMCLFDTRLWQLDAETPNVLWPAKQSVSGTPVEMSTLFKINIPPTTGTEQSLGNASCIFPMDDKLVIFFPSGIQYINGVGPDNTGATSTGCSLGNYSQPIFITASVGCSNQASIVLTTKGLMFQSDKGIWLLGRDLSTSYIGDAVEGFNGYTVTSAVSIPDTTYVQFTLNTTTQLMYDYYYNQWGTFDGINGISSCLYDGLHSILDVYGRVGQVTPDEYLDFGNPVLLSLTTGWLNLAGVIGYQRLYEFLLQANYLSPHFIKVQIAYDYNPSPLQSGLIRPRNFSSGIPSGFGDPVPVGGPSSPYPWRVHAKKQLSRSFQITLTEVFDESKGVIAGAGFTLSSIMCWCGIKKGKFPVRASNAIGLS